MPLPFVFRFNWCILSWIMDEIDLQCTICPKQPKFCDLSHLLTHVASKAHLASQFGLNVRSAANPQAANLLQKYDDWYKANDLGTLLSARLATKEQRGKRKSEDTSMPFNTQPTKKRHSTRGLVGLCTPTPASGSECLDPRLVDPYSDEQREDTRSPVTPTVWTAVNSHEKAWTGPILRSMDRKSDTIKLENGVELQNSNISMYPVTPTQPRRKKDNGVANWTLGQDTPNPIVDSAHRTRVSGKAGRVRATGSRADEVARLKGVIWPGMDCFDAATEQMRRRRNQKKDGTVLKQMEITSLLVEPSELIFSPLGGFLKERVITGNVEEESPLKGETPIPHHRQARPKNNLTYADPNVPFAADRKRQRIAALNARKIITESAKREHKSPRRRPMAGFKPTATSHDGELDLAVNAFSKRARGGFDVFADEGSKQTYPSHGMDMGSKEQQFGTLTPTRLLLDRKQPPGTRNSKIARAAADKENIEPILNSHDRIGFGLGFQGWHSPLAKRSEYDHFGTQYLDESPFIGHSGSFNSNDKSGHLSNPLFAPKSSAYENPFKGEHEESYTDWQSIVQAPVSEETISEEEKLEYPGVYLVPSSH